MAEKQKKTGEDTAEERYQSARAAADSALSGLSGRQPFSYDPDGDALYRQYRDKYVELGRDAMADTVGRASALTGGYSNSYAVGAGNQAYANYLKELNDLVPELEARAYSRWKDGNEEERKLYDLLSDAADRAYSRYRDEIADGRYADETAYKRNRDLISDARYADETAYKRARDQYGDSRAAYEYENDLNYKYDNLLASKGYDLRTEEGRTAARTASQSAPQSTGPAPDEVPAKADTVIAKLASYLDNGQTESAARLIAAYRAMGYTGWANLMAEIYLNEASVPAQDGETEKQPSGGNTAGEKTSGGSGKQASSGIPADTKRPDGTSRTVVPVETAEERGNEILPAGVIMGSAVLGALEGMGDLRKNSAGQDSDGKKTDPGRTVSAVADLLAALNKMEKTARGGVMK